MFGSTIIKDKVNRKEVRQNMAEKIGRRIVDRRKNLHMSQETLAQKANISRPRLSMIENGKCSDIRVSTLVAISLALDVNVEFFLS